MNKLFVPYVAVIIAILSVGLVTSDKIFSISGTDFNHILIICNLVLFLFSLCEILFGENNAKSARDFSLLCCLMNIALLLFLLSLATPEVKRAINYLTAYNSIYKPKKFIVILGIVYAPLYLLEILNNVFHVSVSIRYSIGIICSLLVYLIISCFDKSLYGLQTLYWFLIIQSAMFIVILSVFDYYYTLYIQQYKISHHKYLPKYFIFLSLLCVTLLINSHSICYKFITFPLFGVVSASGVMFPFTFLLADVVAEHYGYSASRILIWSTLIAQFIFVVLVYGIYLLPPADYYSNNIYFAELFKNLIPRQLLAASMCVFFSFFIFSFLISVLKSNLQNKRFWKRTLIANIMAKSVLCFFSYTILYGGQYDFSYILSIIWHTWLLKMIIATIGTFVLTIPLIYYLKLNDQRATLYKESYNPFSMELKLGNSKV